MINWKKTKISSFLKERESRIKPSEANKMGLGRLNKIDFSGEIHIVKKQTNTDMILIKQGDLVISGINVEKGAVAVYQSKEDILATIHYSAYIFDETKIDIEYFKTFLKSKAFREVINSQIRSGIKTELKAKKFLILEINLPNLEDQIEIKNKINLTSDQILEVSTLNTTNYNFITKLRQTILQEAVQGKLVKQDPKDEPASELLKKIKAEKDKLIKDGKIKKQKPLVPISEDEIPYKLPKGWVWCRLGDVCDFINGRAYKMSELLTEGETPILRVGNLFTSKKWYYSNLKLGKEKYCNFGDLLFAWSASFGPFIWDRKRVIFHYHIWKLNLFKGIYKKFLYYYLLCDSNKIKNEGHGLSMNHMTKEKMLLREFPLPPLPEQKRIVTKVDELMKFCDELEEQVKENKKSSELLMGAILSESFENGK